MSTELAQAPPRSGADYSAIERVIATGDLAKLSPQERVSFYRQTCESLGLNPLTQPFQYITLSGKLTLYARRDCTDQLRKLHGVSITSLEAQQVGDIYVVRAQARDKTGREDCATGAVCLTGLRGEALANALMKAETKSKRRVTLSICGLGFLDETEIETVPDARPHQGDPAPRNDGMELGGNAQTDAAFIAWAKEYHARYEEDWADYWSLRLGGDLAGVGDLMTSFQLTNHLVKFAGADPSGMRNNAKIRLLGARFAENPDRIKAEADSYLAANKAKRTREVETRLGLEPEDDEPQPIRERIPGEDDD